MVAETGRERSGQADVLAVILASGPVEELLAPLAGHPLVAYSVAAALEARAVGRLVVVGDPRLVEVARHYAHLQSRSDLVVEDLLLPAQTHSDREALAYAVADWKRRQPDLRQEMVAALRAGWPLYPRRALDQAVELLRQNPQADEIVSVVPRLARRWWADGGAEGLAPLSLAQADGRLFAETGHFRVLRLPGVAAPKNTRPFVLDPQFGLNAADPSERGWAEWQAQFSSLDMAYPGHAPRPLPEKVALLVMDFDGVLTDNRVWVDEAGREQIAANRSDSLGLDFLRRAGIETLVISMETNPVVTARCRKIGVPVLQGIDDKAGALSQYMAEKSIDPARVVYLGNDVNDLVCFPLVACAVAVADSLPRVLHAADLVLTRTGGHAAVRELCDLLVLRAGK